MFKVTKRNVHQGSEECATTHLQFLLLFLVGCDSTWYVRHYWPIVPVHGDCGAVGGMRIGRGNRSTRRKFAPTPLCSPQIPHEQARAQTRVAALGKIPTILASGNIVYGLNIYFIYFFSNHLKPISIASAVGMVKLNSVTLVLKQTIPTERPESRNNLTRRDVRY
jgi:hypothetical protein